MDKHIDGNQFVQGVREYSVENNLLRKLISKTLSLWLKMLFFKQTRGLKDIKSGFSVTRKSLFQDIFNFFPSYKYSQSFIAIYANFKCKCNRLRQYLLGEFMGLSFQIFH